MTTLLALLTLGGGSLISLLIGLLVLCIVIYVIVLVLNMLPLPAPVKQIAYLIVGLIGLLLLLEHLGYAL